MDNEDIQAEFGNINKWLQNALTDTGVPEYAIRYVKVAILLIVLVAAAFMLQYIVRKLLLFVFRKMEKATSVPFFGFMIKNRLPHYLALVVPYSFVRNAIPILFESFPTLISPAVKITDIYLVFMVIWTVMALIRSLADLLQQKEAFATKPFKSYLQVINIILFIFGAVVIYSIFTGRSATGFFAAMGAASAVLMLMFQDTIKGFAASIQMTSNKMVQIGDWITMNKYGADGTVDEINLTTVKVINFDKTITTIPTYAMIADSFQNWRGMKDSGGRRFKRSLFINQSDIRFLSDDELEKMKKITGLVPYIIQKQTEYARLNGKNNADSSAPVGSYRITNCDLFVQYAAWYLRHHPNIHQGMTLMVRTLTPETRGLPVELYSFTNTTVWTDYEYIVTEIVSHLLAVVNYFDLRIFTTTNADPYEIYIKQNNADMPLIADNMDEKTPKT